MSDWDDWREAAETCQDARDILSSKEEGFIDDILENWDGDLTEAQEKWLSSIYAKVQHYSNR